MSGIALAKNVAVLLLASFIVLGPAYRQVLGGENDFMPKWTMFSGMATGFYAVRVAHQTEGNGLEPVSPDLVDESGRSSSWGQASKPRGARRLRRQSDVRRVLQNVCRHLTPSSKILVDVRLAGRKGWKPILDGKEIPCASLRHARRELW